jgi:hypothetical protein
MDNNLLELEMKITLLVKLDKNTTDIQKSHGMVEATKLYYSF